MANGKPRRQRYALPSEYAPGGAADVEPAPDVQAVRTLPRDEPAAAPPPPLSRRERRQSLGARSTRARRRSPRAKWIRRGVLVAVVVVLVPLTWSYVQTLRRPGAGSLGVRTVEWVRDHGGNGIVNTIERWWHTNNPPVEGGEPAAIPAPTTRGAMALDSRASATLPQPPLHLAPPTARVPTPAPSVEPNEGVWMPAGRAVEGLPAEYVTYVRPDAVHTSFYVALMWLDTALLRAKYVPGLAEPGEGPNPWRSRIPGDEQRTLIAAFNAGLELESARGGVYLDGREVRGLVDGAASLVIRTDGSVTVGKWNRDVAMGPDVESVRQNLELLVDNGKLDPELLEGDATAFDSLGNNVYVWRSGVGVDANGALIYAGGDSLSARTLAKTLQAAGAVRAMELDIDTEGVSAFTYVNASDDPTAPVVGRKLAADMEHRGDRYLRPGERDFFAFFADPTYSTPSGSTPSGSTPSGSTPTSSSVPAR